VGTTLVKQADGLAGLVESLVPMMESERRLTDEVVAGIRATGLNRSWVPAELGGEERHVVEVLEAIERIAAFDGSTGWCASIGCGSNVFAAPPSGRADRAAAHHVRPVASP
jgi:alkylation response protein AidB-like acyl-CoA dehydrogenase